MGKDTYWEKLAMMYHQHTNPQPVQMPPQTEQSGTDVQHMMRGGMATGTNQGTGAVQHLEEGGEAGGDSWGNSDWSNPAPSRSQAFEAPPTTFGQGTPASPGTDWGTVGKGFLGSLAPAAGKAATAMLIDKMFPGTPPKTRLLDTRQPEMQQGSTMALDSLTNLRNNPNSFGLPGDPNDVNTPAGQRQYQIKKNVRSASAAAGGLETGGGAQRETDAINKAIGDSYQTAQNSGFQNLERTSPPLQPQSAWSMIPGVANHWAKALTEGLAPGVGAGIENAMGNTTEEKRKKASWGT